MFNDLVEKRTNLYEFEYYLSARRSQKEKDYSFKEKINSGITEIHNRYKHMKGSLNKGFPRAELIKLSPKTNDGPTDLNPF